MTDDDFRDAIADNPDDDLFRYAYADWLEERGDGDRAEFIRLRVELSREESQNSDKKERATALLNMHRESWLGPLIDLAAVDEWGFPRGVPEQLHIQRELWSEEGTAFLNSPSLARLTALYGWRSWRRAEGAVALANSPHLTRLRSLAWSANRIGDEGAQAIAASPYLARLTSLTLASNGIGLGGAIAFPLPSDARVEDQFPSRRGGPCAKWMAREVASGSPDNERSFNALGLTDSVPERNAGSASNFSLEIAERCSRGLAALQVRA